MKRSLLYLLILAVVLVIPVERTDVGKLQPVQTVAVFRNAGQYVIATDTGDRGEGRDPVSAYLNLEDTTPGVIYLDTAEFLLVAEDAVEAVDDLRKYLKDGVELYYFTGDPSLEEVSRYLSVHGSGPKLEDWKEGGMLPILKWENERMEILPKKK